MHVRTSVSMYIYSTVYNGLFIAIVLFHVISSVLLSETFYINNDTVTTMSLWALYCVVLTES